MTNLLSAISGKFSTSIVLGTFFPVTLFVVLFRLLVVPFFPGGQELELLAPLRGLGAEWEALVLLLVALLLTGLLHNLNISHIRLYEGYPWQHSWLGYQRKERFRRELEVLEAQEVGCGRLLEVLKGRAEVLRGVRGAPGGSPVPTPVEVALHEQITALGTLRGEAVRRIRRTFPKKSSVLPTRLGNVIRSFENYPERQYQIAAIPLWPRLIAKIPGDYSAVIDDTKSRFDFLLNLATLSGLLALCLLLAGLASPAHTASFAGLVSWLLQTLFFAWLALWLYRQSVERAMAWGDLVKSAFDLYRWELLRQLGYTYTPTTPAEERQVWANISSRIIFGDPPAGQGTLIPYTPAPRPQQLPTTTRSSNGVPLTVIRGVTGPEVKGAQEIVVEVWNSDSSGGGATGVSLRDQVPDGYEYMWGSASVSRGSVVVAGVNPYEFQLGDLRPGASVQVTYKIVRRTAE